MTCKFNRDICSESNCNINFVNRYTRLMNLFCNLNRHPIDHIRLHVKLFYRFREYRPFLLNIDTDFCDYVSTSPQQMQPFMDAFMPMLLKYSPNLNKPCPYFGNYSVVNARLGSDWFANTLVPAGQYRVNLHIYSSHTNTTIVQIRLFVTILGTMTTADLAMG